MSLGSSETYRAASSNLSLDSLTNQLSQLRQEHRREINRDSLRLKSREIESQKSISRQRKLAAEKDMNNRMTFSYDTSLDTLSNELHQQRQQHLKQSRQGSMQSRIFDGQNISARQRTLSAEKGMTSKMRVSSEDHSLEILNLKLWQQRQEHVREKNRDSLRFEGSRLEDRKMLADRRTRSAEKSMKSKFNYPNDRSLDKLSQQLHQQRQEHLRDSTYSSVHNSRPSNVQLGSSENYRATSSNLSLDSFNNQLSQLRQEHRREVKRDSMRLKSGEIESQKSISHQRTLSAEKVMTSKTRTNKKVSKQRQDHLTDSTRSSTQVKNKPINKVYKQQKSQSQQVSKQQNDQLKSSKLDPQKILAVPAVAAEQKFVSKSNMKESRQKFIPGQTVRPKYINKLRNRMKQLKPLGAIKEESFNVSGSKMGSQRSFTGQKKTDSKSLELLGSQLQQLRSQHQRDKQIEAVRSSNFHEQNRIAEQRRVEGSRNSRFLENNSIEQLSNQLQQMGRDHRREVDQERRRDSEVARFRENANVQVYIKFIFLIELAVNN